MTDRAPPQRHPSTAIPAETVAEAAYRWYLRLLEPPMTPEQSQASTTTIITRAGRQIVQNDAHRRRCSVAFQSRMRDALRVLVDIGTVKL